MTDPFAVQILNTIILRPYFVAFLLTYLLGCTLHLGLLRALFFGVIGYCLAWVSEYSSIHTGIPFGDYFYIELTKGKELWLFGVPFMDSMSFVFLAYASYSMALLVAAPVLRSRGIIYVLETKRIRRSVGTTLLGALFFVYLDIIIDPVALQGSRWFLGQIYGYPDPGVYFGVPISNFIGWFLVGLILVYALQTIDRLLDNRNAKDWFAGKYPVRYLIGPALYAGVVLFNLWVTFSIGEDTMGWAGIFIMLLPAILLYSLLRMKLSDSAIDRTVAAHLKDFPSAVLPRSAQKQIEPVNIADR